MASLSARVGGPIATSREEIRGQEWFWASLPAGDGHLSVGFPHSRIGPRPIHAVLASLAGGTLLTLLAAWWLARRTTRPLQRLQQAVTSLGRGQTPEHLPETGPREIAALSRCFNEMTKQVENLLAARTVLLAGVLHDLRTPLARLRLAVEMLVEKPSTELAAQVEGDIEAADITLEVPVGALRRILANLLENALRYGGGRPVTLQVETGNGLCRIGVLDRGPGIPATEREAVFRPFYRLEASRNVGTGGSGLGLAIVRQLAAAQGWDVSLDARPGGGLAVWLQIALPPAP
jgi:two-component system osmolarity sensor histidine kinase EnvZ